MEVKIHAEPIGEKEQSKEYGKYDKWEIESAVRTLIEAEEIKNDSEKMKYVSPLLKSKAEQMSKALGSLKEVGSIDEIKEIRKQKLAKSEE